MNILIIEDEPRTGRLLIEFIKHCEPAAKITAGVESIAAAVDYLKNCCIQPDLLFLDIELADGNSFEIFDKVEVSSPVVFCTAYEDFTLQAFKTNGIAYILKPFTENDVKKALNKITSLKNNWGISNAPVYIEKQQAIPLKKTISHFLVSYRDKMYPVNVDNVATFYIEDEQVYLLTFKNEKYQLQRKIEAIEEIVDPGLFFRISRQVIINREAIECVEPYFNRKLFVRLKVPVTVQPIVSRLKVSDFINWIENR